MPELGQPITRSFPTSLPQCVRVCVCVMMRVSLVTGTLSDLQYVHVCVMRVYGRWEEEEGQVLLNMHLNGRSVPTIHIEGWRESEGRQRERERERQGKRRSGAACFQVGSQDRDADRETAS